MPEFKGSALMYGVTNYPLTKKTEHIYIPIKPYDFKLAYIYASWTRNPATTKDLYIEIVKPASRDYEFFQNIRIPIENIITPGAFNYVDHTGSIDWEFEGDTTIHLIITGQDPSDPAVINISCLGLQRFTADEIRYGL